MPPPSRLRYERAARRWLRGSHQHGANRRAQSLRQAEHHGIGVRGQFAHRAVQMAGGVEDARAVHVNLDAARRARCRRCLRTHPADRPCRPPCCACSRFRSAPVGAQCGAGWPDRGRECRPSAGCRRRSGTGRTRQPENQAIIESSQSSRCARDSQITSWPCSVWILIAMVLPMVPVGTNRPASLPRISAARCSRRLTVGSSP